MIGVIFIKRKIFVAALLVCCLAIIGYSTVAYYTTEGTARNVITSGKVSVKVEEWHDVGGELIAYPYAEGLDVMPGNVISKIVTVKNEASSSFVRARYTVEIKDGEGNIMEHTEEELDALMTVAGSDASWIESEGWYYYKTPLDRGQSTLPLFETVEFSGVNMDNRYQGCTIRLIVETQSVQAAHNGDDVLKVQGWGE